MINFDKQLKAAIAGVTFPSEGEPQPLEFIRWGNLSNEINEANVRALSGEADDLLTVLDYFGFIFPRTSTGDQQKAYQAIDELMQDNLNWPVVYRFGAVNVRFYAIGRDTNGAIAGFKACAVQT